MARRKAASGQRPIPVSGSGVIFDEWIVPNGVGTETPPAKVLPPGAVWQALQFPIPARSRPRLTSAGSKDCGAGGSIPSIAGRQTTAKAAIAPPISAATAAPAIIPDFDIRPKLLLLWDALLAQLAGWRPNSGPAFGCPNMASRLQNRTFCDHLGRKTDI